MKTEEDSAVTGMRLQAALIARASPVLLVQRNGRGDVAFDDIGESLARRLARLVGWMHGCLRHEPQLALCTGWLSSL